MPNRGAMLPPPPSPPAGEVERAFEERLLALQERMYACALARLRRYGARALREVEDVLQGAVRRVLEARQHAPPPDTKAFDFWVLGHVRNACRDRLRKFLTPERMGVGEFLADPEDDRLQSPARLLETREVLQAVVTAIADLPILERQALVAHYRRGLSPSEIAHRYSTTRTAVESRIQRGRERVRHRLRREGWSL
ncbi:MAG TPA: sigma-70 family RNA polymerase sigma factor [Planctomycetota bacterium]|nr:sigma-70 family RNA polymerase sigma factor [Planctomycetota bacterium]